MEAHRDKLMRIAEELLIHEVLDGNQVNRIAKGLTIDEPVTAKASSETPPDDGAVKSKNQPKPIVPPVPSLDKVVQQE